MDTTKLKKILHINGLRSQTRLAIRSMGETRRLKREVPIGSLKKRLWYLGVVTNNNIGDNAQNWLFDHWLHENFPKYEINCYAADIICNRWGGWMNAFDKRLNLENDLIVFQSGYNTHDLGGCHDKMHRLIADTYPTARMLVLPQTVYFLNEENKHRTSESHDKCSNMVFMARDSVSFGLAKEMFPHLKVILFPDIVTTLIGKYNFNFPREKIFICRRNDVEKFYSENEIIEFKKQLETICPVDIGDTEFIGEELHSDTKTVVDNFIAHMAHYKVVITDRYHGTILSLCANTPVIIIKSTDHKVTTGAVWFDGLYDRHVYVSKSLFDAFEKAREICADFQYTPLEPHFDVNYYSKLREMLPF